jgi:hypothetical protein
MANSLKEVNDRFEPGLLDACLESVIGEERTWRMNKEPHIAEMARARILTRKYIILLWEKRGRIKT